MKIMTLCTVALLFASMSQGGALAQTEALAEDALVTVTFGAVMMQVPAKLAGQLCPGIDPERLAEAAIGLKAVACEIPHEQYTSHDPNADQDTR
jgi:hypothetical protein